MLWIWRRGLFILMSHLFYLMAPFFGELSLIFSNVLGLKFPSPYKVPPLPYPDHALDLVIACCFGRPLYNPSQHNPSQHKLAVFRQVLVSMISSSQSPLFLPLIEPSFPLSATITFHIRRPNSHFVNSRRNKGLRRNAPRTYVIGKLDLDNLVKFTLDANGGMIYVTDGQICHISCWKVWDEGHGSTTCVVSRLEE
jgi:Holliday junction resolvase RusA-like endonuclease